MAERDDPKHGTLPCFPRFHGAVSREFEHCALFETDIYSTHSRWIENGRCLSNRFAQSLDVDVIESLIFLFGVYESIEGDESLRSRSREYALHTFVAHLEATHNALRLHKGRRS